MFKKSESWRDYLIFEISLFFPFHGWLHEQIKSSVLLKCVQIRFSEGKRKREKKRREKKKKVAWVLNGVC
jgi:uncharacterized membrane protein